MKSIMHSELPEGYIRLCSLNELNDSEGKRFMIDDTDIALFRIGNEVYALSNVCPHQRSALIYDGYVETGYVVCPAHGWKFNLVTGKTPSGSGGLTVHETAVIDSEVYVKIKERHTW